MDVKELLARRLDNHRLGALRCARAVEVVSWFGAVQAQDFPGAAWAITQRIGSENAPGEFAAAFARGDILRTHVLRPTWHLVAGADLPWLIELTGARVNRAAGSRHRQLGLDGATFARSNDLIEKALTGSRHRTRAELGGVLVDGGVEIDAARLTHITMHAELRGLICSGKPSGATQTYALVRERVPHPTTFDRPQALAELTRRYFRSHGPATMRDFRWWSGLTAADAGIGHAQLGAELIADEVEGDEYLRFDGPAADLRAQVYLLPNFDEYTVGYTGRSALLDTKHVDRLDTRGNPIFQHVIVADGVIVGTWKRPATTRAATAVVLDLFVELSKRQQRALTQAVDAYLAYRGAEPDDRAGTGSRGRTAKG